MQVAREFTHERTKQRITYLNVIAMVLAQKPRRRGLTRWVDQLFAQEQLRDLRITEPAFMHCPALLGTCLETPDQEQYDSTQEDTEEDEGDASSVFNAKLDASMGEETDASGHSCHSALADRHCWRNCSLQSECNRACWEFLKHKNRWLSFPLFRETTKEDAISYRDWHSEVEEALEMRMYTELKDGSQSVAIVLRNLTSQRLCYWSSGHCQHSSQGPVFPWPP